MKTKLGLIGLLMIFNIFIVNGQTLSKEVRNDFCINAKYNYFYGTNSFFGLMNLTLKRIGISDPSKMDEAVKNICNNESLQNSFFESVHNVSRGLDKQQYLSMGMKYSNVEKLTDYIISKNNLKKQIDLPKNPVFEDDLVNESNKIDKKQLLQSLYPKTVLINDSTVSRSELYEGFGGSKSIEVEYKTTVVKEYSYADEKNDEDRLKIILFSKSENKKSYFDIVIMVEEEKNGKEVIIRTVENWDIKKRRLYIDKSKENIKGFTTIKENGKTYFVINYIDENNINKSDYYTIDLKLVKTLKKNEYVGSNGNQDNEIIKLISNEDSKKTFLPNKLTNSKQLFNFPNFKYRMINLVGSTNYDFIEKICVNEVNITNDSNYLTLSGFREKGFNTKNKDNYIVAIDPTTQKLFVGIRKENKIVLYGEEKVFPNEIYQWKLIEENIK
ncbi:hypothetical protein [Chryseobacterium taihuense]|uniref:Uncharacterized protein n=1 Tax=Chryseobacterium taihuense TaxID=1141221 RepID=A0ABY0R2Y8_9FLAO|nr:hypothetical protein [Chryseobacterium taihuense]SDM33348.1 hypothetical protein SAMN05216273_12336 [Chryseobacterium taihuense]